MPMEDAEILRLFAERDERAIREIEQLYGNRCRRLAERILGSREDAEECVSDACLQLWISIPPECPNNLQAYLTTVTRNFALNRLKHNQRLRRGGGQATAVLDELEECIPSPDSVEREFDRRTFIAALERFLDTLSADARKIFVQRYWNMHSCKEIADAYQMTEVKVRVTLTRTRNKLRAFLEKEESR